MASTSDSKQGGIQLLLAAEQEAQQVISSARASKTARLRQAKEEAHKEAEAYRLLREEEFQKKKAGSFGDSDSTVKRLEIETEQKIQQLYHEAAEMTDSVTEMLLRFVTTVKI